MTALVVSFSRDMFIKKLNKDDFKFPSQEFDNNILDLVKQKEFYPYEYMSNPNVELWRTRRIM